MKAFVLCAGRGERLWPLSSLLPKCLWPIGGVPCAKIIAEKLDLAGITPVICTLMKDRLLFNHEFRDGYGDMHFDSEPLGTAGQLMSALKSYPVRDENFIVWYGDCLVDFDKSFIENADSRLKATPGMLGVLLCTIKARSEFGRVVTEGTDGSSLIIGFDEKPLLGGYTWTGVGVFAPGLARYLGPGLDLGRDVFPQIIKEGGWLFGYATDKDYYDIGNIQSYNKVNELASKGELFS